MGGGNIPIVYPQQFGAVGDGTLYQCKVYKGLLSDATINKFIQEGTV